MSESTAPYPRPRIVAWAMFLFFLTSIASVMDRKIISLLVDPLRADLGVSDVEIGILQGAAFAICYTLGSFPFGFWADRHRRSALIFVGLTLWSAATLASGFVTGFVSLFICRLLVGFGEASLSPAVVSMIADMAPRERRGRLMGLFLMGQSISNGLSISLVGLVLAGVPTGFFGLLPSAAGLTPWRVAFWAAGAFGLLIALLLFTLPEPTRRAARGGGAEAAPSVREAAAFIWRDRAVLLPFLGGYAVTAVASYGLTAWGPTMLVRQFGMSAGAIGAQLGPMIIGTSVVSATLAGWLADRLARRGSTARMSAMPLVPFVMLPGAASPFVESSVLATALIALSSGSFVVVGTLMLTNMQDLMAARMRGLGTALTGFAGGLVGFSIGPLVIAMASTALSAGGERIGLAMALVMAVSVFVAAWLFGTSASAWRRRAAPG